MIYIVYTVLFFNLLIIIFKLFEKYKVDNLQALIVNYFTAAACGYFLLKDDYSFSYVFSSPWVYYSILIGFIFIVVFNFYAFGTQKVGIAVTTVANKMSLIIPVCAALILYPDDKITLLKGLGFVLALIGIYLSSTNNGKLKFNKKYLWLIVLVFVGQGISDSLFMHSSLLLKPGEDMKFFITLFLMAGLSGIVILLVKSFYSPVKIQAKNFIWGIIFGIPNFFSLYFFLEALSSGTLNKSVIFPLTSIGVVVSSAIIGIVFYRELLSRYNWIGIMFALAAIGVFSL